MPARDKFHEAAKTALVKDGWLVTDDPLKLKYRRKRVYVDLGAEKLLAAEKGTRKIAVEVKSFLGTALIADFYQALGQFMVYHLALSVNAPERELYLAVPLDAYQGIVADDLAHDAVALHRIRLIVYDPEQEVILQWTN